jgi:hypothetical protein
MYSACVLGFPFSVNVSGTRSLAGTSGTTTLNWYKPVYRSGLAYVPYQAGRSALTCACQSCAEHSTVNAANPKIMHMTRIRLETRIQAKM